jgi:hypothetical protein
MTKGSQNGYWAIESKIWLRNGMIVVDFFLFGLHALRELWILDQWIFELQNIIWANNWNSKFQMTKVVLFELLGLRKLAPSLFCFVEKQPTQHKTIIKPNVKSSSSKFFLKKISFWFLEGVWTSKLSIPQM